MLRAYALSPHLHSFLFIIANRSGCHLDYGTCLSGLKSLEGLVARQCPLVGDHAIIDLIKSASSLVTLDLQVYLFLYLVALLSYSLFPPSSGVALQTILFQN